MGGWSGSPPSRLTVSRRIVWKRIIRGSSSGTESGPTISAGVRPESRDAFDLPSSHMAVWGSRLIASCSFLDKGNPLRVDDKGLFDLGGRVSSLLNGIRFNRTDPHSPFTLTFPINLTQHPARWILGEGRWICSDDPPALGGGQRNLTTHPHSR